ncbi:MAG: Gfo/Idh/MocA family oxidoreductase [Thaumarchaeota archaeon]|nr:Gfo/Idh/MocA family oxidoreductase [Nitrososphaerota archaeon]
MVKELGVGMLGYAFMGKAHTNALIKMPIFFYPPPAKPKLVAIFGRTEDKVKEAAKRFGYKRYYTRWEGLIKDPEVEIVDNGLPNNMHHDPCIMAVELGKHVICEKPLARTSKEAEEMYRAAEKAGVKHMTAFNYRFVPAIRLAKKLINEGYIGKILQFRGIYLQDWITDPKFPLVWRLRKEIAGSGALGDLGSHVIDLARFLVGEIDSVVGMMKTFVDERPLPEDPSKKGKVDVDDAFIALVRFHNGAIGSIEATRFATGRKNHQRIEIHGSEGSITFNLERLNELEVYTNNEPLEKRGFKTILVTESVHPFADRWWPPGHIIGWEHTFVHEIYHFFDAVANDKPIEPWGATFYDGLRVNQIMDAIARSAENGKWQQTK